MKILIPSFVFGRSGGYRVLANLANEWIRAGHEASFLVPSSGGTPYFPTGARILRVDRTGVLPAGAPLAPEASHSGPAAALHLYRGLNQIGAVYDVILANHAFTTLPCYLARTGKARLFYYIQAYEPDYYLEQPLNRLAARLSYRLPFTRIVNGKIYRRYKEIRADHVVPPGIDLEVFRSKPVLAGWRQGGPITLGCIGRSEPDKGIEYALRAFERLARDMPAISLRVAYGNLPHDWSHPAAEIVKPQNDRELSDFYRSVDVIIAPGTVQHGAPHYPVMEAMACGTTVVTTGYMPASPDNAWLVANRSVDAICTAVCELWQAPDEARRRAEAGLAAVQEFAWDRVAGKMISIFEGAGR